MASTAWDFDYCCKHNMKNDTNENRFYNNEKNSVQNENNVEKSIYFPHFFIINKISIREV